MDNSPLKLIIQQANPATFFSFIQTQPIDFYYEAQTEDGQTTLNSLHQIVFLDLENLFMLLIKHLKGLCSIIQLKQIINFRDLNGNIPIFHAVFRGNLSIVKCLIENGSEVNASNSIKKSILHFAAQGDQTAMLIYFKDKYKHNILQKDIEGSTPLHYSCFYGSLKAINFILSWLSVIDIPNNQGETPLYLALFSERTHLIKKLVMKGANPYIKRFDGKSIVDIAKDNSRFRSIYEMLIGPNRSSKLFNSIKSEAAYSFFSMCVIVTIIVALNAFILLPAINSYYHTVMYYFLFLSFVIFCSFISMSDSGIMVDNKHMSWLDLIELNVNVNTMCPYCKVKKDSKSKHCHICNHCIREYDHHCNWINNCIGAKNSRQFIFFLIDLVANLAFGYYIGYTFYHVHTIAFASIKLLLSVVLMTVYSILCIPVIYILYSQLKKKVSDKLI